MKVNEHFISIEGEGINIGKPTLFIRFYGCNLHCTWCDTQYANTENNYINHTLEQIMNLVKGYECINITLTGGEPLLQPEIEELTSLLLNDGYHVTLETNGSIPVPPVFRHGNCCISMDCKTPSSGYTEQDLFNYLALTRKDQLKFVIQDENDYLFCKKKIHELENIITTNFILQPCGGRELKNLAKRIKEDHLYNIRLLPQLQKIIWKEKRGV